MTPPPDEGAAANTALPPSERYRRLVEVLPDAVLIHQDGRIRYANAAAATLFGAPDASALVDLPAAELVHPDCRAVAEEQWLRVAASLVPGPAVEEALLRLDGTTTVAVFVAIPFEFDGAPAVLLVAKDAPDRRSAEQERILSAQYSQHALDAMSAHVCVLDEQGTIVALNRAWTDFSTPNPRVSAGIGANYYAVCEAVAGHDASDARRSAEGIRSVMRGERREFVYEYGCDSPNQERWFEMRATRLVLDGRVHAVVAHTETTARKHAERALAEMEEQLRQSQKLEAMGRLAAGIAHDFNNLLTVVNNYADFALAGLPDDHAVRADVNQIRRAGDRAAALTRQLLAFSRREVARPRAVDLNRLIADLQPMLARLLGEDVELAVALDPAAAPIVADPSQVEQVIVNLAINGRDAMPSGGALRIETRCGRAGAATDDSPATGFTELSVRDNGLGMDDETKSRVFEPFFTTKPAGRGTGLGLSTVFTVVKQAGGDIAIDSAPGRGTVFQIRFPAAPGAARDAETSGRETVPTRGRGRVLLVEDDATVRNLARRILDGAGFAVTAPASATEAIAIAEAGEQFDLIVSDLVMPDMSGRDLVLRLEPLLPAVKVLYMSGYTADVLAPRGIEPRTAFLPKPFRAGELLRAVREALDGPVENGPVD